MDNSDYQHKNGGDIEVEKELLELKRKEMEEELLKGKTCLKVTIKTLQIIFAFISFGLIITGVR